MHLGSVVQRTRFFTRFRHSFFSAINDAMQSWYGEAGASYTDLWVVIGGILDRVDHLVPEPWGRGSVSLRVDRDSSVV